MRAGAELGLVREAAEVDEALATVRDAVVVGHRSVAGYELEVLLLRPGGAAERELDTFVRDAPLPVGTSVEVLEGRQGENLLDHVTTAFYLDRVPPTDDATLDGAASLSTRLYWGGFLAVVLGLLGSIIPLDLLLRRRNR